LDPSITNSGLRIEKEREREREKERERERERKRERETRINEPTLAGLTFHLLFFHYLLHLPSL
jgi:hypothetical protein